MTLTNSGESKNFTADSPLEITLGGIDLNIIILFGLSFVIFCVIAYMAGKTNPKHLKFATLGLVISTFILTVMTGSSYGNYYVF